MCYMQIIVSHTNVLSKCKYNSISKKEFHQKMELIEEWDVAGVHAFLIV